MSHKICDPISPQASEWNQHRSLVDLCTDWIRLLEVQVSRTEFDAGMRAEQSRLVLLDPRFMEHGPPKAPHAYLDRSLQDELAWIH